MAIICDTCKGKGSWWTYDSYFPHAGGNAWIEYCNDCKGFGVIETEEEKKERESKIINVPSFWVDKNGYHEGINTNYERGV